MRILLAVFMRRALGISPITDRLALRLDQTMVAADSPYLNRFGATAAWVAEALTRASVATVAKAPMAAVAAVAAQGPRAELVDVVVMAL